MESKTKGSFQGWDEVWKGENQTIQVNPNFTRQKPKTIYQFWQKAYANDLLNLIKSKKYETFCELGSGRGTTSMYLSDAGYHDITMVDLSIHGFNVAKNSFEKNGMKEPVFVLADVEKTGIDSNSFDCIYNIGLLEHFEDPSKTLQEAYRLLKREGMIFMPIVPKLPFRMSIIPRLFFNPLSLLKQLVKLVIGYKNKDHSSIFRNSLKKNYYQETCKKIGYKNVTCISYNPYWKVNDDGFLENHITLPFYQSHYSLFKKNNKISLKCSYYTESCYLLLAYK